MPHAFFQIRLSRCGEARAPGSSFVIDRRQGERTLSIEFFRSTSITFRRDGCLTQLKLEYQQAVAELR
jgi:hypothetical protein